VSYRDFYNNKAKDENTEKHEDENKKEKQKKGGCENGLCPIDSSVNNIEYE
jgi:hypothetical protein